MRSGEQPGRGTDGAGILILTHGPLGAALLESVSLLCLGTENIHVLCLGKQDDEESYSHQVEQMLSANPSEWIVLIDLYGGTPYRIVQQLKQHIPSISAITGVNIPMLMEAISLREAMSAGRVVRKLEKVGKGGILLV